MLDGRLADLERISGGRFSSDPMAAYQRWDALREWADGVHGGDEPVDERRLGPPVPRPAKVFGIGVNYKGHAAEAKLPIPKQPMVFTKFPNCLAGPRADVVLTSTYVDWEAELVAVIGRGGRRIPASRALEYVAGYCVGQDISDRMMQFTDVPPQFSMGKSADTFRPIGPAVISLDAVRDPNDLAITCDLDSLRVQEARTSDLIFAVPELIEFLSSLAGRDAHDGDRGAREARQPLRGGVGLGVSVR